MHRAIKNATRKDLTFALAFVKADINHLCNFDNTGFTSAEHIAVVLDRECDRRAIELNLEGKRSIAGYSAAD